MRLQSGLVEVGRGPGAPPLTLSGSLQLLPWFRIRVGCSHHHFLLLHAGRAQETRKLWRNWLPSPSSSRKTRNWWSAVMAIPPGAQSRNRQKTTCLWTRFKNWYPSLRRRIWNCWRSWQPRRKGRRKTERDDLYTSSSFSCRLGKASYENLRFALYFCTELSININL